MVEMTETANILHNASEQSLVLMDEVGRGTSTFDGLALAWAAAEHLATRVRCFILFATHYFEMTQLPERVEHAVNVHLTATEHEDSIVFLHNVHDGPASQSYGLQVARLAGVPPHVISRARQQLALLENEEAPQGTNPAAVQPQVLQGDMFASLSPTPLETSLLDLELDDLSPRQALEWLYDAHKRLQDDYGN